MMTIGTLIFGEEIVDVTIVYQLPDAESKFWMARVICGKLGVAVALYEQITPSLSRLIWVAELTVPATRAVLVINTPRSALNGGLADGTWLFAVKFGTASSPRAR